MNPLFFIGQRKSGTTIFVRAFNRNPEVFCAFERNIMWLLYVMSRDGGVYDFFTGHPVDDRGKLWWTLGHYPEKFLFMERDGITQEKMRQVFFDITWAWAKEYWSRKDTPAPLWIGEKNPEEACVPEVAEFTRELFPEAKYLHVVRHPYATVGSQMRATRRLPVPPPPGWVGSRTDVIRNWVKVEQQVLAIKEWADVLTVRYEDFTADPPGELGRVAEFLGVREWSKQQLGGLVKPHGNDKYDHKPSRVKGLKALMEMYGYE